MIAMEKDSLCHALNVPRVQATMGDQAREDSIVKLDAAESADGIAITSGPDCSLQRHVDNLSLGALDFEYVPSQMMATYAKRTPTVGDLCVRLGPLVARTDAYATLVDLYNAYCVKGSPQMAARCLGGYLERSRGLLVPAMPIQAFVSEWNRTLKQFRDVIRCTEESQGCGAVRAERLRASVVANVIALVLETVPANGDYLWFVLHCLISRPSLVRQAVQIIGSVASVTGSTCHTGEVDDLKVPGKQGFGTFRLYLIAKSSDSDSGNDITALDREAGVTLGLIWVHGEEELYDHLRNARNSYFLYLGTEAGNTFRCAGFCQWQRYDRELFGRMRRVGEHLVGKLFRDESGLAGDTADSIRALLTGCS